MHPGYPELVKIALSSDSYWHIPTHEITAQSVTGLFGDSIAVENHTQRLHREEAGEVTSKIRSIVDSLGNNLARRQIDLGERLPDTTPRQLIIATEDSRHLIGRLSISNFLRHAGDARIRRKINKEYSVGYQPPNFEEDLEEFHDPQGSVVDAEAIVRYDATHLAVVCRSLLLMKRTEAGQLVAAPGRFAVQDSSSWEAFSLKKMPDVAVGNTYSKDQRGAIHHLGKIVNAYLVEPRHVVWRDNSQRPKRKRHKRRLSDLRGVEPGRLAVRQV